MKKTEVRPKYSDRQIANKVNCTRQYVNQLRRMWKSKHPIDK